MSEKKGKGSKMKKLLLGFVSIIVSIVVAAMSAAYIAEFKNIMDDIINSGELESIVQDAVDSSIDDLETMEPDEQKYVSGVWLLNNELTRPEVNAPLEQAVNVKLEWDIYTVNVSKFIIEDSNLEYGSNYDLCVRTESDCYDLDDGTGYLYLSSDDSWSYYESRFWDFGDTPQAVSEEFYNWLIANAVQEGYVSGVWVFDESSPYSEVRMEQSVNFSFEVDGGVVNCNLMVADPNYLEYQPYTDETDGTAAYDSSWCLSRTVDFGTTPQQVSVEFYQWLTAHAVKQ